MARILLVDDHAEDRLLFRTVFEADGHEVREACNGREALELAAQERPDLVMSDILMPELDGFQLCRAWQKDPDLRHVPFVFCTATYGQQRFVDFARELGAARFLLKPIEPVELRRAIAEVLAQPDAGNATVRLSRLDDAHFHELHSAAVTDKISEKIEELERANRRLVENEAVFRELFEANPLPTWVFERAGLRFLAVNHAATRKYGWSREEFLGMSIADIRPASDVAQMLEAVARHEHAGEIQGPWRHRLRDGTLIDVEMRFHDLEFDGHPARLVVVHDITERNRAQQAIERHARQLELMLAGVVNTIMKMGELRDPYTAGHERRVGELSAAVGAELGLDADRLRALRTMGYLHDVGKVMVPAEILVKPTRLSGNEFALVREHAEQGYEILRNVEFPWPVADVVRQHHERLDGSGYPRALAGDAICLDARILAVADVVEAMSSHRPYRASLGIEAALEEIARGAGTIYDAQVVAACQAIFQAGRFRFDI